MYLAQAQPDFRLTENLLSLKSGSQKLLVQKKVFFAEKTCWKCDFWASRWTEISKFSGALPLGPVGGAYSAPPNPPAVWTRFACPDSLRSSISLRSIRQW